MNVRRLALDAVNSVLNKGGYSNIVVDNIIKSQSLLGNDRAFFCSLVYGVIEKKLTLDFVISSLCLIPESKIEQDTKNIIRLGLYQIMFMDKVPEHAAVNEAVDLAPKRSKGFVNSILRNYIRKRSEIRFPDPQTDLIGYLSVRYSVLPALAERLVAELGEEAEGVLDGFSRPPMLTLRTNTLRISREELVKMLEDDGIACEKTRLSSFGIRLSESAPVGKYLQMGLCFVQDEASQIATAALDAQEGNAVVDMCSAPGSKSFGAAIEMKNRGSLLSCDLHKNKLSLVESGAKRLGISIITTLERDGREFDPSVMADRIICDVPCSGFGVIAKKPELRYKHPEASSGLPQIQLDILNNAAKYLKKGGVLVYSTCTVFKDENEENVKRFLEQNPDFRLTDFSAGDLYVPCGYITLRPDIHGTDGFFIARLTRI